MRVYLDDEREAPAGWTRVRTAAEAIALLQRGGVTKLSLDHDLGDEAANGTGYDVLLWLEKEVLTRGYVLPAVTVHSANPVARSRMELVVRSLESRR